MKGILTVFPCWLDLDIFPRICSTIWSTLRCILCKMHLFWDSRYLNNSQGVLCPGALKERFVAECSRSASSRIAQGALCPRTLKERFVQNAQGALRPGTLKECFVPQDRQVWTLAIKIARWSRLMSSDVVSWRHSIIGVSSGCQERSLKGSQVSSLGSSKGLHVSSLGSSKGLQMLSLGSSLGLHHVVTYGCQSSLLSLLSSKSEAIRKFQVWNGMVRYNFFTIGHQCHPEGHQCHHEGSSKGHQVPSVSSSKGPHMPSLELSKELQVSSLWSSLCR